MKKMIPLVLGSLLLLGATACNDMTDGDNIRSDQRESDLRARDQRSGINPATDGQSQNTGDLTVDIRNSLERQLPGSRLAVDINDNNAMATINGTVQTQEQLDQIEPIVMTFEGIKSVDVKAEVDAN